MKFITTTGIILSLFFALSAFCQEKNFIDKPYIETLGSADTLVVPDRIYIDILISEKDAKGKKSVEALEKDMLSQLKAIGIDTDKSVFMQEMYSNYKKFFLKATDIQKSKSYSVIVRDAKTAAKVFIALEDIGLSNAGIDRVEYSGSQKLMLLMNYKAIENARQNAMSMTKPLNQKVGNAIFISNFEMPKNYTGKKAIRIRGQSSSISGWSDANDYNENLEFEKILIASQVNVKFSLE